MKKGKVKSEKREKGKKGKGKKDPFFDLFCIEKGLYLFISCLQLLSGLNVDPPVIEPTSVAPPPPFASHCLLCSSLEWVGWGRSREQGSRGAGEQGH